MLVCSLQFQTRQRAWQIIAEDPVLALARNNAMLESRRSLAGFRGDMSSLKQELQRTFATAAGT